MKPKHIPPLHPAKLLCVLALLAPLPGCSPGKAAPGHQPPQRKMLVILLDSTSSFAGEWSAAVEKAGAGIKELNPNDALMVLAITDRGWQSRDILIPYTQISPVMLHAMHDRAELRKRVRALKQPSWTSGYCVNGKPIGRPKGTDLEGCFDYCNYLCNQTKDRATSICVFSDLENEAPKDYHTTRRGHDTWPRWTHVIALHVRASGGGDATTHRITEWCNLFNAMRDPAAESVCTPSDFHLIGQDNVTSFFDWTRR